MQIELSEIFNKFSKIPMMKVAADGGLPTVTDDRQRPTDDQQ